MTTTKTQSKHTPGPWSTSAMTWARSDRDENKFQRIVIEYSMDATKEQIKHDMCLISAAPELLEAVKRALFVITLDYPEVRGMLEAAIAKAEGK